MAEIKIPVFESGCVLTREMLDLMKNVSLDTCNLSMAGFSDGIVSGCRVSMEGNVVSVERGIVKHDDQVFFIPAGLKAVVMPGNEWHYLQFRFGDAVREDNFWVRKLTLEIAKDDEEAKGAIEVCRFRLQSGARLRNEYKDYNDLNTEYDTVNEIYAKWSGYGKGTVSLRVLNCFAQEAIARGVQNPLDQSFIQMILNANGRSLSRDGIQFYLSSRLATPYKEMTNLEIYKGFAEVLRNLRTMREPSAGKAREERRIIVD